MIYVPKQSRGPAESEYVSPVG